MIKMTGSEKQIAWAEDIKNSAIGTCDANIKTWTERSNNGAILTFVEDAECYKVIKTALGNLFSADKMQSATFVIDNRNSLPNASKIIEQAQNLARRNGTTKLSECKKLCGIK